MFVLRPVSLEIEFFAVRQNKPATFDGMGFLLKTLSELLDLAFIIKKSDKLLFGTVSRAKLFPIFFFLFLKPATGKPLPAFPGAEGFGSLTPGGRGGRVLFVTTLLDYIPGKERKIPGSLRAACEEKGPRIVVFRLSGIIELRCPLVIKEPFITIAGQSAPGDGVCLKNYGLYIATHDVVIRYLRVRPGDEVGRKLSALGRSWETDAISVCKPSRNVIIDHCSASWANDEVCSVSGEGISEVTVSWCMITESLNRSTHKKGRHGYGSLIRTNGRVTYHHNLYAFHVSRCPRPGTYGDGCILFDFRNNVIYRGGSGYTAEDPVRMNFVGNWHPDTPFRASSSCLYYQEGNVGIIKGGKRRSKPFRVAYVHTTSAEEAFRAVLREAGATKPKRDAVDRRIVPVSYTHLTLPTKA